MKRLILLFLLCLNGTANAALECYNDQGQYFSWTIGEAVPYLDTEPGVYVACSAAGNELAFIQENFTGIRYAKFTDVEWTGEDATFIYQNLSVQANTAQPANPVPGHHK
jgi:hypothetical protein